MNKYQLDQFENLKSDLEESVKNLVSDFQTERNSRPELKKVYGTFLQSGAGTRSYSLRCEYTEDGFLKDKDIGGLLLMADATALCSLLGVDQITFELDEESALVFKNKAGDILPIREM